MSREDRARWDARHRGSAAAVDPPSAFLVEHVHLLPAGRTVDLAAGSGRNAAFLARRGHAVVAVDVSWQGLARVRQREHGIACIQMDLDAPAFRRGSVDAVVVVSFLDRRLFAEVTGWLRPGGVLLWDTFLVDQRSIGHPREAAFLARCGHTVVAVDVSWQGVARVRQREGGIACVQMDLDAPAFRRGSVDAVVVVSFLDRRLFAGVAGWLRPGGVLLWDTFLVDQRSIGHPREAAFLLERGELAERLRGAFDILAAREGLVEEGGRPAWRSGVVARRRATESGL